MHARPATPPRSDAFTLIEMILVMTILTVAVALTAPSLSRFFRGRALDSEARRLLSVMRHGEERAVSEGVPVQLEVDAPRGQFELRVDPTYQEADPGRIEFTVDTDIQVALTTTNLPSRTTLLAAPSRRALAGGRNAQPAFRFLPDGTVDETSPDLITLTDNDGFSRTITRSRNRLGYEIASPAR